MKTPRQARSAVTSRSNKDSPQWQCATDVFKSPKSPSPVRRVTRRTSVYQQKKKASENTFKMPLSSIKSPPGVKTRARRSSIYQKGAGRLTSPPTTRARRASMYVAGKARQDNIEVFSKVWATPIRQPEPIKEVSPEKLKKVQQKSPIRKQVSPVKQSSSPGLRNPTKSRARRSLTPERKSTKTPRSAVKKSTDTVTPVSKTPATKTPRSVSTKVAASAASTAKKETNNNASATPAANAIGQTPKKSSSKPSVLTSTPSKTLEEISGKSFYGTPGETPIKSKRLDEVFVFSALKSTSAKKQTRNTTIVTPASTKVKLDKKKSPKRMPARNTPAPKRRRDSGEHTSPPTKRTKAASPVLTIMPVDASTARVARTAKRTGKRSLAVDDSKVDVPPPTPTTMKLSPIQMTSVLESAKQETERETMKRKTGDSPSPLRRGAKQARTSENLKPTPRVFKVAKRSSQKKLAEISSENESNNAMDQPNVGDVTILDVDGENYRGQNMYPKCTIL